jgi:hypothetical protein
MGPVDWRRVRTAVHRGEVGNVNGRDLVVNLLALGEDIGIVDPVLGARIPLARAVHADVNAVHARRDQQLIDHGRRDRPDVVQRGGLIGPVPVGDARSVPPAEGVHRGVTVVLVTQPEGVAGLGNEINGKGILALILRVGSGLDEVVAPLQEAGRRLRIGAQETEAIPAQPAGRNDVVGEGTFVSGS